MSLAGKEDTWQGRPSSRLSPTSCFIPIRPNANAKRASVSVKMAQGSCLKASAPHTTLDSIRGEGQYFQSAPKETPFPQIPKGRRDKWLSVVPISILNKVPAGPQAPLVSQVPVTYLRVLALLTSSPLQKLPPAHPHPLYNNTILDMLTPQAQ